ncbi:MAG: hypothetical protein LBK96_06215 [Prevotellaceae bacterium]|jgi:hypothetical protein|nr:hypothetical protein [Prevotellaceae bacterium]
MAKKKRKVNLHAQQKIQAAHLKKLYMERLRKLCTLIGNGEPLFDLLPQHVLDSVYISRGGSIKISVANNVKITKRLVKIMHTHLEEMIKKESVDLMLPGDNKTVSITDYHQVMMALEFALISEGENFQFAGKENFQFAGREKFDACFAVREARYVEYYKKFTNIIIAACFTYSDLSRHALYTYEYGPYIGEKPGMVYHLITLDTWPLDVRYVDTGGDRFQVIQTGLIIYNNAKPSLAPTTVSMRRLLQKDSSGKKTFPVYIRQHAIDRVIQRLNLTVPGVVQSIIQCAFKARNIGKIIRDGDMFLVETCLFNTKYNKVGYFVGMLVDEMFVIVTFLLITHKNTPEGRKLAQLAEQQCKDTAFLAIDDLKTLVNSNVLNDPCIFKIFWEAGCESILTIKDACSRGVYDWLQGVVRETEHTKLVAEYMQLGDSDKDYFSA